MVPEKQNLLEEWEKEAFPQPFHIPLKHPVLLSHGYGAIASLFKPSPLHEAALLLRRHGIIAFAPNVEPYARIEPRARSWKDRIQQILETTDSDRVNVIAHSMGGLDMRYAISELEAGSLVASLTTLSTPHRGTSLAELALNTPSALRSPVGAFFDWLGDYLYPASESDFLGPLEQLTRDYMNNTFNKLHQDDPSVAYYSYSAAVGLDTDIPVSKLLSYQNNYIYEREGMNDGFVSVESAKWGQHRKTLQLSHMEQMKLGISEEREPIWEDCWLQIARKLSSDGF